MGSGPIIISDDGSPPPGLHTTGDKDPAKKLIRIGRQYESMPELTKKNSPHAIGGGNEILEVTVSQGNRLLLASYAPNKVTISGAKAHVTVSGDGRVVKISADEDLNDDSANASDNFSRYETDDTAIQSVQIDDITVDTSKATPVKVKVYL
jgi:hypothetical protein